MKQTSQPMDAYATNIQSKLQAALNRGQQVNEGLAEMFDEIRMLEMMVSHYNAKIEQYVMESGYSIDVLLRQRSAGAAVALQDVVHDLERRIKGLKAGQSKIAVALGG